MKVADLRLLAIACLVLAADANPCAAAEEGLPRITLQAERNSDFGNVEGKLSLTLKSTTVTSGDNLEAEVLFDCHNGAGEVFNPFLDRALPLTVRVVVFSTEGDFLGDLLVSDPKIRQSRSYDLVLVRSNEIVGSTLRIPTSTKPTECALRSSEDSDSSNRRPIRFLGPGTYFVQAIHRATPDRPGPNAPDNSTYWNSEKLGRSKAVRIEVKTFR
ncbi:MAG: hypothetical protein KDA59_18715 [Planctomycetales bacterium]|nr:hypothetical protein [Planctomycetales bacterium]